MQDTRSLMPEVVRIARRAGERIMEVYRRPFTVTDKEDDSPLTEADLAANEIILEALATLTPDIPALSEESGEVPWATRSDWSSYWLVDPLDGTREFVNRNDEFTVNIALIRDHRPVLGVVQVPPGDLVYSGGDGLGAFRQCGAGDPAPIRVRRLTGGPVVAVASRSHRSPAVDAYLAALGNYEVTSCGSSLKFCRIAEGRADVYPRLGPTCEWDTAAAQAVVEAAGGRVTDTRLRPLRYNRGESLLNPHFLVFGDSGRDWSAYLPAGEE
ncbi:MAG TPA: 3'(2'),5'-bisphosphate nucleotidase CysQ [Gammaproteobacteria bacterium]|nr:3'(2'),5'-bisphosphate nucleotidase CysQ [Gammaproteobacteria bacterium]